MQDVTVSRVEGKRSLLHFEAIDYVSDVWVNGLHVAQNEGGQNRISVDITDALNEGSVQRIVVRTFDSVRDLTQPRGKQDWLPEPHAIWYKRTSGIWREVWIEHVAVSHIEHLSWLTFGALGDIRLDATAVNCPVGAMLEVSFSHNGLSLGKSAYEIVDGRVDATIRLVNHRLEIEPDRLLWSPDNPVLIDASVRLVAGETILDEVASYVGLRTVGTDGGDFLLNGRPLFLRLVLEQAFWPDSHLAAPSEAALVREAELIKELGFNGVRMHQTSADPRFLYWCDRMGIMVWADSAAAYEFSARTLQRTTNDWARMVQRDRSHPCIVAWVPYNESWGVVQLERDASQRAAVASLYHLTKAIDPSRVVLGNDGWEYSGVGDMLGIHDYTPSGGALASRYGTRQQLDETVRSGRPGGRRLVVSAAMPSFSHVPVVLSEFGGIRLSDREDTWLGYSAAASATDLVDRLRDLVSAVTASTALAGFCYTQLTDTLQERNGLLTEDRVPKANAALLSTLFQAERTAI